MKVLFFKSLLWSYMTLCCLGLRIHISKDISVNNCSQILDLVEVSLRLNDKININTIWILYSEKKSLKRQSRNFQLYVTFFCRTLALL